MTKWHFLPTTPLLGIPWVPFNAYNLHFGVKMTTRILRIILSRIIFLTFTFLVVPFCQVLGDSFLGLCVSYCHFSSLEQCPLLVIYNTIINMEIGTCTKLLAVFREVRKWIGFYPSSLSSVVFFEILLKICLLNIGFYQTLKS